MAWNKEQVQEKIKQGAVVINVLKEDVFKGLHIPGSINIPLGEDPEAFAGTVEQKVGKSKAIITHCSNDACSAGPRAATILRSKGFNAEDYPGGMKEWQEAGFPVEGTMVGAAK